jgi:hypothetical protein
MKIAKSRLRELIQEELHAAGLGDLQSDEKFTGGSPEERLLTLMKAREVLAAMSKEDLTALSKSLDAEQVAVLRHILANPMYAPAGGQGDEMELEEGSREDEELLNRLKQKYGRKADHFTVADIQDLHSSYKGSLRDAAQGLGIR